VLITVDPRTATTTMTSSLTGKRGVAANLTARLRTAQSALIGKPLTFYVDGVPVGTTASASPTKLSYTPPAGMTLGTHTLTVKFAGDLLYRPSEATATLTIKK
jgi:hypothetical protein